MVTRHDYGKSEVDACLSVLVELINAPGPIWLINFEDFDDEEEKERLRRDAYERVNAFLDALGIEEFKKG